MASTPIPDPGPFMESSVTHMMTQMALALAVAAGGLFLRLCTYYFVRNCVLHFDRDRRLSRDNELFAQKVGQLPIQVAVTVLFPLLACLTFVCSRGLILSAPFTGWDTYLGIIFSIFLGNLISELVVSVSQFPSCQLRFNGHTLHLIPAIIFYIILIWSEMNAILGLVTMVMYYCNVHAYLHSILKYVPESTGCLVNLILWLITLILFGFILPTITIVLCSVYIQTVLDLPVIYFSLFCLVVCYLLLLNIFQLRTVIVALKGSRLQALPISSHNSSESTSLASDSLTYGSIGSELHAVVQLYEDKK